MKVQFVDAWMSPSHPMGTTLVRVMGKKLYEPFGKTEAQVSIMMTDNLPEVVLVPEIFTEKGRRMLKQLIDRAQRICDESGWQVVPSKE